MTFSDIFFQNSDDIFALALQLSPFSLFALGCITGVLISLFITVLDDLTRLLRPYLDKLKEGSKK